MNISREFHSFFPTHETLPIIVSSSSSTVPNQPAGAFWAVLNRLLIIFQVIALILSEIGWPVAFFNRYFPVLGSDFGLGALGVMQCLYVSLRDFAAVLPLTRSCHVESARPFSRITSTILHSSRHFSCFLLVVSTSCWDLSSGNTPRPSGALLLGENKQRVSSHLQSNVRHLRLPRSLVAHCSPRRELAVGASRVMDLEGKPRKRQV